MYDIAPPVEVRQYQIRGVVRAEGAMLKIRRVRDA